MKSQYAAGLSGQAIEVYKLLLTGGSFSAKEIEYRLKITRQNVYRLTEHLISNGLIDKVKGYPVKYTAKSVNEARKNYLAEQGSWFSGFFSDLEINKALKTGIDGDKPLDISFFQSRDEILEQNIKEINSVQYSIKYIILALPAGIPAEMMRALMDAVRRGVELKIIALEHTKENNNLLMSYKHIGAQVKLGKSMGWHLSLFDDNVSHITMFDTKNPVTQMGVRLVHTGMNRELQGIFEKYWNEAEPV